MTDKKPTTMEELRSNVEEKLIANRNKVNHSLGTVIQDDREKLKQLLKKDYFEPEEVEKLKRISENLELASRTNDSGLERLVRLAIDRLLRIDKLIQKGKLKPDGLTELRGLDLKLDDAIAEGDEQREDEIRDKVKRVLRKAEALKQNAGEK